MANSKWEYVKKFERDDSQLPNCWMVVRIDGRAFTRFSEVHQFEKPNDIRGLNLMNECALAVCKDFTDIIFAYGQSDEYSFVLHKNSKLFTRRASKITTTISSLFASNYVFHWSKHFPTKTLQYPPAFDARLVLYPTIENLRDYLNWRQADCHINNLYNACFWNLVKSGKTNKEAEEQLKGTLSDYKNELLFSQFNINYNTIEAIYRKGSIIFRRKFMEKFVNEKTGKEDEHTKKELVVVHEDIIADAFWKENNYILKQESKE